MQPNVLTRNLWKDRSAMKFELRRIDQYSNGDVEYKSPFEQPFPQAALYSSEEYFDNYPYASLRPPQEWFAKGKYHEQSSPFFWRRTLEKRRWTISLATLKDAWAVLPAHTYNHLVETGMYKAACALRLADDVQCQRTERTHGDRCAADAS